MKDRILVYIEDIPLYFGIVKYLQEKHDCELFAIFDINKQQKGFYQDQNLVSFKKIWFFRDHIHKTSKTPDLKYLKKFEDNYGINLWQLAYSEREFIHYNELYRFSDEEILNILQQECIFFENLISEIKPDFLMIKSTDYLESTLLHELSKAKGVRTLMLGSTKLSSNRVMISSNYDQVDDFLEYLKNDNEGQNKTMDELRENQQQLSKSFINSFDKFSKERPQVNLLKKPLRTFRIITNIDKKNYNEFYSNYHSTKLRFGLTRISGIPFLKKWYRKKFLDKNSLHHIPDKIKFVYFPLHVEPERNMLLSAPFYTNQIELIGNIAKSLPVEYVLLVKEHPIMKFRRWRKISYYNEIMRLPNVQLVHPEVTSEEIFQKCSLVITISGSSAIQAAFYEKPSLVFSDTIYSKLPFVSRVLYLEDLPKIIRECLEKKYDFSTLNEFVKFVNKHTFELDIFKLAVDGRNRFYYGGILKDIPQITLSKMQSYLEDNKLKLQTLAMEHTKKIKQWKIHNEKLFK